MEGPGPWDLTPVHADDAAAVAAALEHAGRAESLAERAADLLARGELAALVDQLASVEAALDEALDYARMRQYSDAAGAGVQDVMASVQAATARGHAALETALDAWRALDPAEAEALLAAPAVAPARYRLRRARALAGRRLPAAVEAAWAARTESARDRWAALQELLEAQVRVPFDDGSGMREWGVGDLGTVLRRPETDVRRAAYAALAEANGRILDVLALAWDATVADRLAEDRLRSQPHPAHETLEREDLELDGFTSLVEAVAGRYPARHDLLASQALLLGLDDLGIADAEAPVAGLPQLAYAEVAELALGGLRALAPVLEHDGRALLASGRVDGETRPGKQRYAITFCTTLDPPAFVGFRYTGQAANVMLLGHELGHAVGLARARAGQPPVARGWPGVVFEVPSVTAELAAGDAFAAARPELAAQVRLLAAQDLAWTVFEAIAFCRVELDLYAVRAAGTALTGEVLVDVFRTHLAELYGPIVPVDERDALVALGAWANYAVATRFYNFQYAVGALVALALHARRRDDPEGFGARYVALLAAGRSASPADQLAPFGLDLGPATWSEGLDELERRFALAAG